MWLHMLQGAAGLTLVQARHVFLMDALTNPSVETQAINRVHRIGQDRETFVYKFFIANAVEEKVSSMCVCVCMCVSIRVAFVPPTIPMHHDTHAELSRIH
jgi:hypothetical protein